MFGSGPHWFLQPGDVVGPSINKKRRGWKSCAVTFTARQKAKHPGPSARQFGQAEMIDAEKNVYKQGDTNRELFVKLANRRGRHPRAGEIIALTPVARGSSETSWSILPVRVTIAYGRSTGVIALGSRIPWLADVM